MDLGETVSARQSHSSVSLILASLFIFVFVCDFASQPSRSSFFIWGSQPTVDSELVPSYLELIFVARALERIGDDAINIAEDSFSARIWSKSSPPIVGIPSEATTWCTFSSNVTSEASNVPPPRS